MNYNLENTLYEYSPKDKDFFNSRIFTQFYLKSYQECYTLISDYLRDPLKYPNHKYLNYFSSVELIKRLDRIKKYLDKDWCGTWLRFGQIEDEKILLDADFCKNRLCPTCLKRYSLVEVEKLSHKLEIIYQNYSNYDFYFLTLAIKNCSALHLSETLKKLNKARSILFGSAGGNSRNFGVAKVINQHLKGYISYTEISKGFIKYDNDKINSDDLGFIFDLHPHFHILLLMDKKYNYDNYLDFIPQNSNLDKFKDYYNLGWVQLWDKALKQAGLEQEYLPTAHIEKIDRTEDNKIDKKTIREIAKYSLKRGDFLPNIYKTSMENNHLLVHNLCENALLSHDALFLGELSYQIHEYRGISSGGVFRGKKSRNHDNNHEDLINISKKVDKRKAKNRLIFRWGITESDPIGKHYVSL